MASIYDFAPSGADSAKDTDFSSNFGFVPIIQEEGKTQEQLFEEGLYAYANMEKDARHEARARVIFGKQLVNKEYAPFWIGEAVRRATGQDDILNAYIALDVPIPENVTDPEQLITTLGRNVLDNYSKRFDKIKAEKDSINQAATDVNKLLAGTITPVDLTEARNQKIQDIYGYSSFDVHSAAQIINSRKHQNITDQSSSFAGTIGYNLLDIPFRFAESTRAAIGGNLSQAARIMLRGSDSPYDRLAKQYGEIADAAFANNLANDAKFLALAKNPSTALKIAQAEIYKQEKKLLEDATMLGRIGLKTHDALQSVYQGTGDYLTYLGGNIDSALGNETIDVRQSQRVSATVADAELAARSDVQDSRGVLGWMEGGVDWGIENAALFSPWTAAGSTASFFRDNAGRAYNATALPDGSIDESLTPLEVSGKAASSAFFNYASRAVFGKWLPPKISKGLTKMGVNSTIGNFLGTAAVTGTEFATIVPAMDAALRWGYDALAEAFGADPRLSDGYKSMLELADNMQTPKHWVTAYTAGSMAAFPGSRAANRTGRAISEIFQCRGLTQQQAEQIRRSTPVHEMAETMQKALEENLSKDKQSVLDNMFTNIRRINDEETKRRKREEGYEVERDLAKQASLRMLGISLADGSDSNHLTIVSGGKLDPITGKYIEGDSRTEYTREDAMLYLGAVFDTYTANLAEHIRHAHFKGKILDALDKNLDGKIEIAAMIDPVALDSIIAKGKQAEALIQSRAKELVEKSKGEDGKPSLSESDARTQASQETHADLHKTHTLAELVNYGKDADMRRQQEVTRNRNQDPDRSAMTNVFVISKGNRSDGSLHRIIKIARNASAPELIEDYAEMWMEDYMFLERVDLFDTWRELSALSDHIIKHKQDASLTRGTLTTLRESNPDLAKRLDENAQDFNGDEIAAIRKDVREAFSVLLLSNLREIANNMNSSMQDWIRPMFNAAILSQHTMLQETAIGKALADSAHFGNFENTAHRLLNVTADHLNKLLKEFEAPTVDTYLDAWYKHNETYDRLLDNPQAFTVEQTDALLAEMDKADTRAKETARQAKAEEEAAIDEAIDEAAQDPANEGLTKEEIALKVDDEIMQRKQDEIAAHPNHTQDADAVNGVAEERQGKDGLTYRYMILDINRLEMLPNFKTGADAETGEVTKLTGNFKRDHDPVRVLRTTDGRLVLISGRHRFGLAKRHKRNTIAAFVYEQNEHQTMEWAKRQDIEWNIADDQARPLDVALFIRGELLPELPPLDLAEVNRIGITRGLEENNFSANSMKGYILAVAATPDVITALRNEIISEEQALYISLYAPLANLKTMAPVGNRNISTMVQLKGLAYAADGAGKTMTVEAMAMERTRQLHLAQIGNGLQSDWFGFLMQDDTYSNFAEEYSFKKRKDYAKMQTERKAIRDVANRDYQTRKQVTDGTGVIVDAAAHSRSKNKNKKGTPQENIDLWKNPWLNMSVIGEEINKAFAEAYPEKWAEMQERKAAEEAAAQEIEQQSTVQGEIPTDTFFGADFSLIGSHAQTWQQYADRAFVGRDGLMRAELDSSQAKLRDGWKNNRHKEEHYGDTYEHSYLHEVLDFPELYAAYPRMRNYKVRFHKDKDAEYYAGYDDFGDYLHSAPVIHLFKEIEKYKHGALGALLHEIQHAIQRIEGFAKGSSHLNVYQMPNVYRGYKKELNSIYNTAKDYDSLESVDRETSIFYVLLRNNKKAILNEINKALAIYKKAKENPDVITDNALYLSSMGEAEAFAVNIRQALTAEERQNRPFMDDMNPETWNDLQDYPNEALEKLAVQALGKDKFEKELKKAEEWLEKEASKQQEEKQKERDDEYSKRVAERHVKMRRDNPELFAKRLEEMRQSTGRDIICDENGYLIDRGPLKESERFVEDDNGDFSADFSVSSLQAWQIDATLGLGDLGHFAKDFLGRFAPVNDDVIDTKIAAITTALRRRLKELQHVHGNSDVNMLIGEMAAILNQVTQLLPQRYRFGLEPYLEFANIYAALRKTGDPITSPQSLPMSRWPEIMTQAFRNQVERLLSDRMTPAEREIFFDLYDETTVRADLDEAYQFYIDKRMELVDAVKAKWKNVERRNEAEQKRYEDDLKKAREQAYNITQAQFADTFNTAYKAVGEMRAHRLISKFLDRAIKKLDEYRKNRILRKMDRAYYSLTPRIQKDGKPVKGTVSMDTYNAALQTRRLVMLTPTQKDAIDEAYQAKVEAAEKPAEVEGSIEVSTYDENGKPIKFTVPVQVYETYACYESMTAEYLASASKALGTLISTGKEAWQLKAEQEKAEIDAFCAPIYQKYAETPDQRGKRRNQEMIFLGGKGGIRGFIELTRRLLTGVLNDAQLFDVISATPALSQFKRVQRSIASAHAYIEASEKRNMHNIAKAALAACGFPDADPENLTHEQDKALNKFFTDINDRKALSKAGKTFTFVAQAPDFYKRFKDSERLALMNRLFKVTQKKDYNPNQLAVLLNYMAENRLVPDDIMQEALDKYGREVDPAIAAKIDIAKAMEYVFPAVKHGHFRNINKTLQEKTAAALEEWNAENKDRKPNVITEMSRNQAAFHVLTTEQADYSDMLRQKGYTPELIQQLKDYAGKDMMNLAYALRELMNARQDSLKAIWESTYGTPFPAVENYYRAFFDVQTKEINDAQMEGFAFGVGGRGEGGMRLFNSRIKHKADIDDRMSATIAFQIGMKQQDNLIAYADTITHRHLGEFLNRVIANRKDDQELDKVLEAALGKDFHAAFVQQVKNMYRVYGYSDAFVSAANRAVRDLGTTAAVAILTARIVSILKNPMAYFNTLGGSDTVNPWEWFKSAARVRLFNTETHGFDITKDSLITDRFKGWDIETLAETIYQHSDVKSSLGTINRYARRGLSAFGAIDRWFTGRSAAIMYDAAYRKFQKLHPEYDAKTLHQLAYGETAMALGMKGQPMDFRQRPLLSTKNSFITAAYFFLGGEAWSTFGDCARLAIKSLYTKKIPRKQRYHAMANLASVWLVNGFTYALMGLSFNALLDDEEQWEKRSLLKSLGWGSAIGPISSIPILSNLAREFVHLIDPSVYISTPSYLPMSDIRRIIREFVDIWDSDASALDQAIAWNSSVRNLFTLILLGSQRPTTTAGAKAKAASVVVAAATNAIDFFLRLARAADERWSE